MKEIRAWYEKSFGHLEDEDIADGQDICDIVWVYEKNRDKILKKRMVL